MHVLRIRTNLWVIIAAALGYFFFAGMRTFALVFVRGDFSISQAAALVAFVAIPALVLAAGALRDTFLIMLAALGLNGPLLLRARRTCPADVATAIESEHATAYHRTDGRTRQRTDHRRRPVRHRRRVPPARPVS